MSITSNNLRVREVINQVVNDPEYKEISDVPLISLPQIGLILLAYTLVFGGIYLYLTMGVSLWILYPFMIFGFFISFTPLHDATHRAASSNKILNDFLGTVSGNLLTPFNSTSTYRYLHLAHHRYVGDKELDPDEATVGIPTKYYPLGYLVFFVHDLFMFKWVFTKVWKRTPTKTKIFIFCTLIGTVLFNTYWFMSPFWYEYLILFLIPNRIGAAYTSYAFSHLPHPEGMHWHDFPFQSTFSLKGSKFYTWSLFGQEHHAIHHFLPHIPWYNYFKVWDLANGAFRKESIPERQVFSRPDPHFKDKIIKSGVADIKRTIKVKTTSVIDVAKDVKSFTFAPLQEEGLPEFTAGAHINISLPSGKIRSYSLVNPTFEKNKYQIAVKLDPRGRGGSNEMHEKISEGTIIEISPPKNSFVLYEKVQRFILISGGIGITPLLSMAHRLTEMEKHFELHICAKTNADIPFQYELKNWSFAPNVEIHLDKNDRSSINLSAVLATPNEDTLIYICGPTGFSKWIKDSATAIGWEKDQIKEEFFSVDTITLPEPKEFQLILNKSGQSITVKKEETIIDALLFNNIQVDYTCLQGTCGTCITNVVKGEVDHRDAVLSAEEKMATNKMCICVSRAKEDVIVLDL